MTIPLNQYIFGIEHAYFTWGFLAFVFFFAWLIVDTKHTERRGPMKNPDGLYKRIASFYDETEKVWEETWGEHMHHAYYGKDGKEKKR